MTPTLDPALVALARALGSREARTRADAAAALRDNGAAGLDALLAVWHEEKRREERRNGIGAVGMALCMAAFFLPLRVHATPAAITGIVVGLGGMCGLVMFLMPTRLQRNLAPALAAYDDPLTWQPLAESLRMLTAGTPEREAVKARLRAALERQPEHRIAFPGTRCVLRWVPEHARRRVRWFWLWLALTLFATPIGMAVNAFLPALSHHGSAISTAVMSPLPLLIVFVISGQRALRESVVYERERVPPWRPPVFLLGLALAIFLVGILDRTFTGHPTWVVILAATGGIPLCMLAANALAKLALPGPPALTPHT